MINAENAAHKSEKFTAMAIRTRYEYLKDLATNFVTTQGIDTGGAKFSKYNQCLVSKAFINTQYLQDFKRQSFYVVYRISCIFSRQKNDLTDMSCG